MTLTALRATAAALAAGVLLAALPAAAAAAPIASDAGAPHAGAARSGITITTRSVGRFGKILVDGRGMPLYVFTADKGRRSVCYGDCARAWPVTFAGGTPRARGGASDALLGTTKRRDGRRQVTYRGRPLYYYVDDRPGLALCHDVREFGGLWLLVRASGKRVP
jgi:predicted lipoprotein with Yx(FWY)xxD motif